MAQDHVYVVQNEFEPLKRIGALCKWLKSNQIYPGPLICGPGPIRFNLSLLIAQILGDFTGPLPDLRM